MNARKRLDVSDSRLIGLDQTSQSILKETQASRKLSEDNFMVLLESFRRLHVSSSGANYSPVSRQVEGVGGYDLRSPLDHITTFDYDHTGKLDHLVLYRPGHGAIFIVRNINNNFTPVYAQADGGSGIGGYDLQDSRDRIFAFDYSHSGKLDHLALYRPGTGTMWILENKCGVFTAVYAQGSPGAGIGGYDLASSADRAFAFDYTHSGKLDHLVLYRPGTGTMWILENKCGVFTAVYAQGSPGAGIGGYDLGSPADRAFAFDCSSSGNPDHIVLYRPGTGTIWILQNRRGDFSPVYHTGDPGSGIGGYFIKSPDDKAFAFDFNGSGIADHLAFYRPGAGTFWILENIQGVFRFVFAEGNPGTEGDSGGGIGGYDLLSSADRAFGFDYTGSGRANRMALYRPGTGTFWVLQRDTNNT